MTTLTQRSKQMNQIFVKILLKALILSSSLSMEKKIHQGWVKSDIVRSLQRDIRSTRLGYSSRWKFLLFDRKECYMEKCHLIVDILEQDITVELILRSSLEEGVAYVKNAIAVVTPKNTLATKKSLIRHNMSNDKKIGRIACKCLKFKYLKLYCECFQKVRCNFL